MTRGMVDGLGNPRQDGCELGGPDAEEEQVRTGSFDISKASRVPQILGRLGPLGGLLEATQLAMANWSNPLPRRYANKTRDTGLVNTFQDGNLFASKTKPTDGRELMETRKKRHRKETSV